MVEMKAATKKEKVKISQKEKKKLLTYRSCDCKKTYHPLKRRKVDLSRIKTIADAPARVIAQRRGIMSKKLSVSMENLQICYEDITGNENIMLDWLSQNGIKTTKTNNNLYVINNQICSLSYLLIVANKKRISMNLKPFFINWIKED